MTIAPEADDYSIHVHCVTACGQQGPLSRHLHKLLDKLFAGEIARVRAIKNPADLLAHWMACRAKGRIAPAFWALMTHPAADGPTIGEIYGDVSYDVAPQRLCAHCRSLASRLAHPETAPIPKPVSRARAPTCRNRSHAAMRRSTSFPASCRRRRHSLSSPHRRPQPSRRDDKAGRLIAVLQRKLSSERARARQAEARLEAMPEPALAEAVNETIRPETTEAAASVDLAGVTVLYVGRAPEPAGASACGGRASSRGLPASLRRDRTEPCHARRARFPGRHRGLRDRLHIPTAPALRIKAVCRRMGRNFMPLRSASASNLQRMLPALVDKEPCRHGPDARRFRRRLKLVGCPDCPAGRGTGISTEKAMNDVH